MKRGDWRSVDGRYFATLDQATLVAGEVRRRYPAERTRIKHYTPLGYAVQTFVVRPSATPREDPE